MPLDPSQASSADPLVSRPAAPRLPAPLMLAGVAAACILGAGLGFWARPTELERDGPVRPAAPAQARGPAPKQIEIRVQRGPLAAPLLDAPPPARPEPFQPAPAATPAEAVPAAPPEVLAPKASPEGLMRVHAVAPQRLAETPAPERPFKAAAQPAAEPPGQRAKAQAARKAEAARKVREEKARIAEAEARTRRKAELARAEKTVEQKAAARRLAEKKAAARKAADKKAAELTQAKARARRLAEEKAAARAKVRLAAAKPAARPAPPAKTTGARSACASPDPGAALACADPALGAAERQLTRAYRQAEAAGVPPERLERQQRRWLAARANAARQAPWAVHDIYLARIAELQDQARAATRGE